MEFLLRVSQHLQYLGIPGLFVIAFLDSAAIPIMGGPDALAMLLAWHRPGLAWLIVIAASAGSTLGCLVLYGIGRAGGQLGLAKFGEERAAWVRKKLDRSAFWSVLVAVIAPPPFPTKLVILAAGAFRIPLTKLISGVLAGRLFRYGLEAYLGVRFGDQAAAILKRRYPEFSLAIIVLILVVIIVRWKRKAATDSNV